MHGGPDIVRVAALIGDHARAQTLTALLAGRALTATELANIAGVTRQTISTHLSKLRAARLIAVESQGRHRYFRLANAEVAHLLENLMGVAFRSGDGGPRSGPHDPAMRKARLCYDHLAGELGVFVYERLVQQQALAFGDGELELSGRGRAFFRELDIDVDELSRKRRVLCRACLDWSERRHHLAGALGAALLDRIVALRWAKPSRGSRIVRFSPAGERSLRELFG
ncbi:MAG: ArsR/SmtB family transcription factor [Steroidobacter sp.]